MKKTPKIITLLFILCAKLIIAQGSSELGKSYVGNINEIFPPAPTSNNLMKFEEVPVSYYTGVPDISIPLFNIATHNKNVNVNVQLKYHPLNAKPDDRSGETGVGWSLIAGGTITRTIRGGGPDEKNKPIPFSFPPKTKYGIYNHVNNPTYKIINNDNSFNLQNYSFDGGIGRFDTEYDLYQYNFMGYSGRFYVVKNNDGTFSVEKLDKNNLKISCNFDSVLNAINSFTIIDDKGTKYLFNGKESSQNYIATVKIGLVSGIGNPDTTSEQADYFTAYHLVRINDPNDINLVEFNYDLASTVKYKETPTITRRQASDVTYTNWTASQSSPDSSMPAAFESQTIFNNSKTKLLTSIHINGKGVIYLNYEQGRLDSNYLEPANLYKLKSIQSNLINQPSSENIEKYIFDYGYSDVRFQQSASSLAEQLNKMLLTKVTKTTLHNQNAEYLFDYNVTDLGATLKKDDWGYYKPVNGIVANNYIATDVLKSITYPTKGKVVFNFEENEYSYRPTENSVMEALTGYTILEPYSFSIDFGQFSNTLKKEFFTIQSAQTVNLDLLLGNLIYYNWKFEIFKKNADNTFSPAVFTFQYDAQTCNRPQPPICPNANPNGEIIPDFYRSIDLQPGTYYASLSGNFSFSTGASTGDQFNAYTKESVYIDLRKEKGGGIRIKELSYHDHNSTPNAFAKKYIYDYKNLDDPQRSSGALVFPKPVFTIPATFYTFKDKGNQTEIFYEANLRVETDYNILPVQKTQGGDVGYKYVTVEQVNEDHDKKGRTEYTYRSPIDFPNEETIVVTLPAMPIPNQDYLRGQLVSEKKYNDANILLNEITNTYTSTSFTKYDGIKLKDLYADHMVAKIFLYPDYENCSSLNTSFVCKLVSPYKKSEKFGITLPIQNTETSYFYKNGVQSSVSTTTNTLYNSLDYPTSVTQLFSDGESLVSSYKYAHEKGNTRLIDANIIGIPLETENKKNNDIISKVETLYNSTNHYLPTSVVSTDVSGNAATEVNYDQYDGSGNLQQYTTRDGIPTTIIWGYNSTLPIAKITGVPYSVASGLATAIITASDNDALDPSNEGGLITALDSFRKEPALQNAQVSTYTYDPMIGVTSIAPPSGIREIYKYDSANRLESIKDIDGKLLKEFKYNYKH